MGFFDVLGVLAFLVIVFLLVQLVRILRSDCDLCIRGRQLKWEYFSGQVVWVVGASGGIGEELCHQLSNVRARIILSDLPKLVDKMENIRSQFASPQSARIVTLDLTDPVSMETVVEEAIQAFGHIDILLLAAGVLQLGFLKDISRELDKHIMEVNYSGQRELIRAVLPSMIRRKSGHIIGISSISGKFGTPLSTSYAASKFALFGMLEGLKYELLKENICVTTVCPGPVRTEIFHSALLKDGSLVRNTSEAGALVDVPQRFAISANRCAELILIAISNQLEEVWIGGHRFLLLLYFRQYFPTFFNLIARHIDMLREMSEPLERLSK